MQGLILAAGMGKRLKELTQDNTKCMVKVNGVRLIDRVLGQLAKLKLKRTVIVTGYEGAKLRKYLGKSYKGMKIDYIDNPIYDKTNNIYSLALAADELVKDDTLLIESDLIFEDSIFAKVLKDKHPNVAVVDKFQSWMDGTCVTIDEDHLIKRFVPKKDFVYEEIPSYYKTVNVYKFSKEFSKNDYVPFLKAYSKALGDNEYYEQVLRVVSMLDKPLMHAMPLEGDLWYEIDDLQDLDIAETMFCPPAEQVKKMAARFGGYWRYPGLKDFCYLVTPYYPCSRLRAEIKNNFDILLESYPSGQRVNALLAAKTFGLHTDEIAVGNGAAEIIQAYMENLAGKIGFVYPTFEEYPNRIPEDRRVVFTPQPQTPNSSNSCNSWLSQTPNSSNSCNSWLNSDGFRYTASDLIAFFSKNPVSNLILINPDNPSGNFLPQKDVEKLCAWCAKKGIRLLIDESFVDFADKAYTLLDRDFLAKYPNVAVMKSISKSHGIPGLRLGIIAATSHPPTTNSSNSCNSWFPLIDQIKKNLSIWNINSFGEFYLQICEKYKGEYKVGCAKLAAERNRFIKELSKFKFLTVYPSAANYVLCKVAKPHTPNELMMKLWTGYKILIKDCSHKKGFDGQPYIRLAVRDTNDNNCLINALKELK